MRKPHNINGRKKVADDQRRKAVQELAQFEIETADEHEIILAPTVNRADIPPPPEPANKGTYENPDGVVDILTFCEHPYYLNLRLTPWQRLIVKFFYAGVEGNYHLKEIDNTFPSNEKSCEGCLWNYVKESELHHWKSIQDSKAAGRTLVKEPFMLPANSPCLTCTRYDDEKRNDRYEHLKRITVQPKKRKKIDTLSERELIDAFLNERMLMDDENILPEVREQIERKIGGAFEELILVLGRRSGKSFLTSIIALYETYRFLMMGHPQARYPIMEFDVITICNVAVNEAQAKTAIFDKIKQLATLSPFFLKHLPPHKPPTQLEMFFLTDHDMKENERRAEIGQEPLDGTIQIMSGHSNSSGLVGRTMAVIIIDEMAEMSSANTDGGTDSDLYSKLVPSIATFGHDGKIICISNPLGPHGKFFELYLAALDEESEGTLMFQLATWQANPNIDKDWLKEQERKEKKVYSIYYGARFGNSVNDPFLDEEDITAAFARGAGDRRTEQGHDLISYFAHLDPAKSSDFYTFAIVHAEPAFGVLAPDGKPMMRIVVDHLHYWEPLGKNRPIDTNQVEEYVLNISKKFRIHQLSFDQWNSQQSISKLKNYGINAVEKFFNANYQGLIYGELRELFVKDLIDFYGMDTENVNEVKLAKIQFENLQKKWRGRIPKIEAANGHHDDIPDAVAAAAYEALKSKVMGALARPRSTYAPIHSQGSALMNRGMYGGIRGTRRRG